jgi:hypothetical protein
MSEVTPGMTPALNVRSRASANALRQRAKNRSDNPLSNEVNTDANDRCRPVSEGENGLLRGDGLTGI